MADKKFYVSSEELKECYAELQSMVKVANKYSVSKKLILNYLKKYGIQRKEANCADATVDKIKELARTKTSLEIAEELNLSLTVVNRHIRKHGIPISRFHKGFTKTHNGYILVYRPDHPNARKRGYVGEHTLKMTEKLGRPLTEDEVVHHIDENKSNNDISNLQLMTKFDHKCLHSRKPRKLNKAA